MMIFVAVLSLTSLISAIALVWTIARDGYGSRPIPRSHHHDAAPTPYYGPRILP